MYIIVSAVMTSRYRVEYALKSHRRDGFIEWIKGLLAVPFVLHGDLQSSAAYTPNLPAREHETILQTELLAVAGDCKRRYLEIFGDVESMVDNHWRMARQSPCEAGGASRLRRLVPTVGNFYTPLPLVRAFEIEDQRRSISKRRFVSPSFNDVRIILSTAQVLALADIYKSPSADALERLRLVTFDGDVTLYEDGKLLLRDDPIVDRLVDLLALDLSVAVVTAAGYPGQLGAEQYYIRLKGLVDAMRTDSRLTDSQRENLLIMGAESNYLFQYCNTLQGFKYIEGELWYLPHMKQWDIKKIQFIMDAIYEHMCRLQRTYSLEETTTIIRKERLIGIIPNQGHRILREILEEMVLSCSARLSELLECLHRSKAANDHASDINGCAFNGGLDVWVDIGDKSLGVECLQNYIGRTKPIAKSATLHIGDQFASVGANDFKARQRACTVWIASPRETTEILAELIHRLGEK